MNRLLVIYAKDINEAFDRAFLEEDKIVEVSFTFKENAQIEEYERQCQYLEKNGFSHVPTKVFKSVNRIVKILNVSRQHIYWLKKKFYLQPIIGSKNREYFSEESAIRLRTILKRKDKKKKKMLLEELVSNVDRATYLSVKEVAYELNITRQGVHWYIKNKKGLYPAAIAGKTLLFTQESINTFQKLQRSSFIIK